MHSNYIIFRKDDRFLFAKIHDNDIDIKSYKDYKKIIKDFIDKGYTITYDDNAIILKSKKRIISETSIIAIMNDERLLESKYLKSLRKDMARVKTAKGYTIVTTDADGNRIYTKKTPKKERKLFRFSNLFEDHAATIGIAITLVAIIASYGLFSKNGSEKANDSLEAEDTYSVSMTDVSEINDAITDFNDLETKEKFHSVPFKLHEFDKSFIHLHGLPDKPVSDENEKSDEQEEENIYDKYLETYAGYYHLDADKVINFAREVTEDYTLAFEDIVGTKSYDIDNPEAACMIFVHQLNRNGLNVSLSDYGLTIDDFVIDPSVTPLPSDKILSNGQTFEQFFGHVCDLLKIDKNWILGISYFETGRLTSYIATNINNFGGLLGYNGFYTYISPEAGIIAHCRNLKGYEQYGLQNIYELASIYVFGDSSLIYKINENPDDPTLASYAETINIWVDSVTWFHNDFAKRSEEVFGPTEQDETDDAILELK